MFKGIIEGTGKILKVKPLEKGSRLTVQSPFALGAVKKGDSIAVNGCCLTVVAKTAKSFEADLSHETLDVTNLKSVRVGSVVNLERPLRFSDRIDGHIVQGHVDGVGRIRSLKKPGDSWEIEIELPKSLRRYVIPKGSITVDGISMTVNRLTPKSFTLVVIPHTFQVTNLKAKRAGDTVNLEVDLIGKYLESLARYDGKKA